MQLKMPLDKEFNKRSILTPKYDVNSVVANTEKAPIWVHFGAGNIFRGYIARLQDDLLNLGESECGIIACETFDSEIIEKIYTPYDNLVVLASLSAKKPVEYRVIASITGAIDINNPKDYERLVGYIQNPNLQLLSFTITEKGYNLFGLNKEYLPTVLKDVSNGPIHAQHTISIITALLYKRFTSGGYPIALVSMDNCSHNGEKLEKAINKVANAWYENGHVEHDFLSYLESKKVSFPWSMIDKITPRPALDIATKLSQIGIERMTPITTSKKTYIAPFVNAEVSEYLVIEDDFPNGRPKLELAGVLFTDRKTVNEIETMKVTTCLNPLHTALAVFGVLLGYSTIYLEMQNQYLKRLVEGIAQEGMRVVVDPKIISPSQFVQQVIEERLPNPSIPDSPWRIATDTSLKIPVRYGETIKAYLNNPILSLEDLTFIPLAIAGWLRYVLGVDDQQKPYTPSSDPQLSEIMDYLKDIVVGDEKTYCGQVRQILKNQRIFGVDLTKTMLGEKIEDMFVEMIKAAGAVENTLKKYCK